MTPQLENGTKAAVRAFTRPAPLIVDPPHSLHRCPNRLDKSSRELAGTIAFVLTIAFAAPAFSQDSTNLAYRYETALINYLNAGIENIKSSCEANKSHAQADGIAAELARTVAEARTEAAQAQERVDNIHEDIEALKTWNPADEGVETDDLVKLYSHAFEYCERSAKLVVQYAQIAEAEAALSSPDRVAKFTAYAEVDAIDYSQHNRAVEAGNKAIERAKRWRASRNQYLAELKDPEGTAKRKAEREEAAAKGAASFKAKMDALAAQDAKLAAQDTAGERRK